MVVSSLPVSVLAIISDFSGCAPDIYSYCMVNRRSAEIGEATSMLGAALRSSFPSVFQHHQLPGKPLQQLCAKNVHGGVPQVLLSGSVMRQVALGQDGKMETLKILCTTNAEAEVVTCLSQLGYVKTCEDSMRELAALMRLPHSELNIEKFNVIKSIGCFECEKMEVHSGEIEVFSTTEASKDARDLLSVEIFKCDSVTFDGTRFSIPSPHLILRHCTPLEQPFSKLMHGFVKGVLRFYWQESSDIDKIVARWSWWLPCVEHAVCFCGDRAWQSSDRPRPSLETLGRDSRCLAAFEAFKFISYLFSRAKAFYDLDIQLDPPIDTSSLQLIEQLLNSSYQTRWMETVENISNGYDARLDSLIEGQCWDHPKTLAIYSQAKQCLSFWVHISAGGVTSHLIRFWCKSVTPNDFEDMTLSTPRTRLGYPFDKCTMPGMYFELFCRTQVFDRLGSQQDLPRIGTIDLFSAWSHG